MSSQNRQTSRRWFEEVWNDRRKDAAEALMTPDAVGHSEAGEMVGLDEFLAFRDRFLGAFPDLKFEVESVAGEGDETAIHWVAQGTHSGDALGIPPCHKPIKVRGMSWHRFEGGVLVEGWDSWNMGALMQHLQEGEETDLEEEARARRIQRSQAISKRIREIRAEVFGEHGGPEVAKRLGLAARTWYNYETGVSVPAEILLEFAELTGTEFHWLMTGEGPRYKTGQGPRSDA